MARTETSLRSLVSARIAGALALFAAVLLLSALAPAAAFAADTINSYSDLDKACKNGGEYVLGADIAYTELDNPDGPDPALVFPRIKGKTVSIDLNGHTIDANGTVYGIEVISGSLTIRDGKGGGKLTGAKSVGICVNGVQNGSFVLEGGEISGNGGGVFATNGGSVTIKGGSIVDNDGCGLEIFSGSVLTLCGSPTIAGNGNAGIRLRLSGPLTIGGAFAPASPVSVEWSPSTGGYTGIFTSGFSTYCTDDVSTYFTSYRDGYTVVMDGEEAAIVKACTVTFVDEDGRTVLGANNYPAGTKKSDIAKPDPTKEGDAQYTYTFAGWYPEVTDVTDTAIYRATYTKTVNKYKVTFVDEDGTTLKAATEYDYGTKAADITKPADPTKEQDEDFTYAFAGWSPEIADVTEAATYTATYDKTPRPKGTLTFDLAGGELDGKTGTITVVANVGDTIKLPGAPTKEGYTFKYWKGSEYAAGAEYTVEGDHPFTAEWEESADEPASDDSQKPAVPATGDPLASLPIALIVVVAIAAACLAFAALKLRKDGEA